MQSVEKSIYSLIKSGFKQDPSPYKGVLYPMFQEPATRISHSNVGNIARSKGNEILAGMCKNIAGDEHRHAQFYLNVGKGIFDADPDNAMLSFSELMKEGIVMPAHLMTDGVYTKAPKLFDSFSNVAMSIGVYTPFDYADILETINDYLDISHISVFGDSAQAQEYLMKLPDRVRKVGERKRTNEPVSFEWLYNRKV